MFIKGSKENPFDLVIPLWLAELAEEREGCTVQEYVDREWNVAVRVIVVEPLP